MKPYDPQAWRFRLVYALIVLLVACMATAAFLVSPLDLGGSKPKSGPEAHSGTATLSAGELARFRSKQTFKLRDGFYIAVRLNGQRVPGKAGPEKGCATFAAPSLKSAVCLEEEGAKVRVVGVAQNTGTNTSKVTLEYGYVR